MDYLAFGRRIRMERKKLHMTQEALAAAAGVSTSYIGHIERGIKHCSLDTLISICRAMGIMPDHLLQDSLIGLPAGPDATGHGEGKRS